MLISLAVFLGNVKDNRQNLYFWFVPWQLECTVHRIHKVLAQRCEEKRAVILDPKFTLRACEVDHSRLTFSVSISWQQVFLTKPDLITTPPRGLYRGTVRVDVEK